MHEMSLELALRIGSREGLICSVEYNRVVELPRIGVANFINLGSGVYIPNDQKLATFKRKAFDDILPVARKCEQTVKSVIARLFDPEVAQERPSSARYRASLPVCRDRPETSVPSGLSATSPMELRSILTMPRWCGLGTGSMSSKRR